MGEESEKRPILVYDGERYICELPAELPEIKLTTETTGEMDGVSHLGALSLEGAVSLKIKSPKCRTRKRFIKLLMAGGMSRRAAEGMAGLLKQGVSYQEAYDFLWWRMLFRPRKGARHDKEILRHMRRGNHNGK